MGGHGLPNKEVQDVIAGMGFKKPRAEARSKMDPRVARMLTEELGVKVRRQDVQEATTPLSAPGSAPAADPGTPAAPQTAMPEATPGKTPGSTKPLGQTATPGPQSKVELKSDVNRITTLQDLKGKMDEIASKISLIDTLSQALMGDDTSDNSIEKHRSTLVSAVDSLGESVDELRSALGAKPGK